MRQDSPAQKLESLSNHSTNTTRIVPLFIPLAKERPGLANELETNNDSVGKVSFSYQCMEIPTPYSSVGQREIYTCIQTFVMKQENSRDTAML